MVKERMWMVRAGQNARLLEAFEKNGFVAIGWDELGDLSGLSKEKIREILKNKSSERETSIPMSLSQIIKFLSEFKIGDLVLTYDPERRIYLIGQIEGDYLWSLKREEYKHTRKVKWLGNVKRDDLSTSTKNTLGSISTIFEINEASKKEILDLQKGVRSVSLTDEEQNQELDEIKEDLASKSKELIKDQISYLDWKEMQRLVAGILRGMGYKTKISPEGPDKGEDISASRDGLGLEDPRIIVEVKHRKGRMGSKEVRSFISVLRQGHKGLYVSTEGFSKEAIYEAKRSNQPLTLLTLDDLVDLIVQYYDLFDAETRLLVPLSKIYWPEKRK